MDDGESKFEQNNVQKVFDTLCARVSRLQRYRRLEPDPNLIPLVGELLVNHMELIQKHQRILENSCLPEERQQLNIEFLALTGTVNEKLVDYLERTTVRLLE